MRSTVHFFTLSATMACGPVRSDLPFDSPLQCIRDGADGFPTVEEAVARSDFDGDGELTESDVRPGEMVLIMRVAGEHTETRTPERPGFSLHSTLAARILVSQSGLWGIEAYDLNCTPHLGTAIFFEGVPDRPMVSELRKSGTSIRPLNVDGNEQLEVVEGRMEITAVEGDLLSGHMDGRIGSPLWGRFPDERPTGQTLWIERAAFRSVGWP